MSESSNLTVVDILFNAIALTSDAVGIFDPNDEVIFCNYPFSNIFGLADQEPVGMSFEQLIRNCFLSQTGVKIDSEDIDVWLNMAKSNRRSKSYRSFEIDTCDNRWFRLTEMIVGDCLFTYGTDITASKNLELELVQTQKKLQQLASTDHLTGIYNRRQFNKLAAQELLRCERGQMHATLMLFDIDHFKQINDSYGHACGDAILIGFADRVRGELRSYDIFGRIGGEEFAVLLPEVNNKTAKDIAQRYLAKIAEVPFYYEGEFINVTTSIGLSESYPKIKTLDYALKNADEHLYQAKQQGRNKVKGPNN